MKTTSARRTLLLLLWLALNLIAGTLIALKMQGSSAILWLIIALVTITLGVIFINDITQKDNPIQKRFPLLYWLRKGLVEAGPYLRQYLFAGDNDEAPYTRIMRNWVYQTAQGSRNTIGFGSQANMETIGSMIILPSTFTNTSTKKADTVGHGYSKVIGLHTGVAPVRLNSFIIISGMLYGALSERAIMALNLGAKKAGILHNTGEGALAKCHEQGGELIFQIGTAKYGIRNENGELDDALLKQVSHHPQVKMIELKLAQGAKPGKGGILLKEKITPEIARIRKIRLDQDAYAPPPTH